MAKWNISNFKNSSPGNFQESLKEIHDVNVYNTLVSNCPHLAV